MRGVGSERDLDRGLTLGGRYRVERMIDRGAMGTVYRAVQLPFGRPAALKVLHVGSDGPDARLRKRFLREASIASQLNHPHIVTVYDFGDTEDGGLFMAMEYLSGRSLHRVLAECGPMPTHRALRIALQAGRALRRAHRHGVVHRDLKPANIVLEQDDEGADFVKVCDFGLVKVFAPDASEVTDATGDEVLTSAGSLLGTPGYMAPEQALGEDVDGRSDIYAFGALLFEMLAGRLPFKADSIVELITQQVTGSAPRVRDVAPECSLPDALEDVIARCLSRERRQRFQSMDEVLAALRDVWHAELDTPATDSILSDDLPRFFGDPAATAVSDLSAPVARRPPRWVWALLPAALLIGTLLSRALETEAPPAERSPPDAPAAHVPLEDYKSNPY